MATANAAALNGTTTYLTRGAGYTGQASSKLWCGAAWLKRTASTGTRHILAGTVAGGGRYELFYNSATGSMRFNARNSAGTLILNITVDINPALGEWICFMWSFDMAGSNFVYSGDSEVGANPDTYTNDTIDFTNCDAHSIFAYTDGAQKYLGDGSIIWMNFGQTIDFSVENNRRIFFGPNGKVPSSLADSTNGNVGGLGQPILFLNSVLESYQNNLGTGGGLTENGTLGAATGPEIESSSATEGKNPGFHRRLWFPKPYARISRR